MRRSEKFGNLGPYPEGASFPKLLEWHRDHGTRPYGTPSERGPIWTNAELGRELTAREKGDPAKNFSNWVAGKNKPTNDSLEDIKHALFGDRSVYKKWRDDLDDAYRVWPHTRSVTGSILPLPRPLIGRDADEAAVLHALLAPSSARAILVRGGPGIGKTSLTRAVGNHADVVERFGEPHRWFVELDTASTAVAMEDAIARAIGLDPANGFKATLAALRQRPGLVVLDNLETPWDPLGERPRTEASLAALTAIPNVAVLASFRGGSQPIRAVHWTLVHPVERLHPPFDRELFQRTAAKTFDGDPHLDDFLRVLDGIPLAIELVALRAHGRVSLASLWERWKKDGAKLASDPDYVADPSRLTSLPRSIELSLASSRMNETALRLFRYLGQLPAGLVAEDRDALLGPAADGFDAEDRLLRIGLAIERSGRLDLLSPIREHALRHRRPDPTDQEVWPAHFIALTQSLGEQIGTSSGGSAMARLRPEIANIEASFRALLQAGRREEAMKAVKGFGRLTYLGSVPAPVLVELEAACQLDNDVLGEANCLKALGDIALARTDHEAARKAYERALALFEAACSEFGVADCIFCLGDIALRRIDHDGARRAFNGALLRYRAAGEKTGEANCILSLGQIAFARWDLEGARNAYEEALSLYKTTGNILGEANCILGRGRIAFECRDLEGARRAFEEVQALYREIGDDLSEANCICDLGHVARACQDYAGARQAYEEALLIFRSAGDVSGKANCVFSLGRIAFECRDLDASRDAFEEAQRLYAVVGDALGKARCVFNLGRVALECGDHAVARAAFGDARPFYAAAGEIVGEANCLCGLGHVARLRGDHENAREAYEEALPLFRKVGDVQGESACIEALKRLPPR